MDTLEGGKFDSLALDTLEEGKFDSLALDTLEEGEFDALVLEVLAFARGSRKLLAPWQAEKSCMLLLWLDSVGWSCVSIET